MKDVNAFLETFKEKKLRQKQRESEQKKKAANRERARVKGYGKKYREKYPEKEKERRRKYQSTPIGRANHLARAYKTADKKHNRGKCTITGEWIVYNIFNKPCHYCGESDWRKLGCDRINNDLPHTPDNVVCCCEECNKKRGTKTFEEFLKEIGK